MPRGQHQPYKSKLIEKRKVTGKGLGGNEVSCYRILFSCDKCFKEHIRLVYSKPEFEKFNLNSVWKWNMNDYMSRKEII